MILKTLLRNFGLTDKYTRKRLASFTAKYATSERTLDIGSAGAGEHLDHFPNTETLDLQKTAGVDFEGDVHDLRDFGDNEYASITCFEVLEHLHSPHLAISELFRVLKPGGVLLVSTRFIFPVHAEPNDYYRFTEHGLRHLFSDFEIIELVPESTTLGALGVMFERIGRQTTTLGFRPLSLVWFFASRLLIAISFVLSSEYDSVARSQPVAQIASSGYYMACRNSVD